jgi:peptidoglycan/LPS O-acetylase OafA/YrhL
VSPSHDDRLHVFDALRAFAMLAVVFAHSLLSFMDTPIGWAIRDTSTWLGADFLVWCIRAFVLPLFFLLSGIFAHVVCERDGLGAFAKRRTTRLLGPLAIFLVPVSLAMNSMWDWGRELAARNGAGRADVAQAVPHLEASELPVTLAHLWFLYYLLIVSLVIGAAIWSVRRLLAGRQGYLSRLTWSPLALVPLLAVVLWWAGKLQLDTPLGFVPNIPVFVFHAAFFVWGWWMYPNIEQKMRALAQRTLAWGVVAIVSLGLTLPDLLAGPDTAPSVLGLIGSAGLSVALTATVLGLGTRLVKTTNSAMRTLSDATYWCYIVHLPVVVLLQISMSQVALPGLVELVVVFGGAMGVSLGSYWYGVRGRWLGRLVG